MKNTNYEQIRIKKKLDELNKVHRRSLIKEVLQAIVACYAGYQLGTIYGHLEISKVLASQYLIVFTVFLVLFLTFIIMIRVNNSGFYKGKTKIYLDIARTILSICFILYVYFVVGCQKAGVDKSSNFFDLHDDVLWKENLLYL